MIPTAATEVVMSGDGIERVFIYILPEIRLKTGNFQQFGDEEDTYQYEYTYEDDPQLEIGEEEVVVTDEAEYQEHWKDEEK